MVHRHAGQGVDRPTLIPVSEHQRVLAEGSDVPEERPGFALAINEVGISAKTVWVRLPQGLIPCKASLYVDLDPGRRGIHMSRMEEAISTLHNREFEGLGQYAVELSRAMLGRQHGSHGRVKIKGRLPQLKETVASGHTSVDTIEVSADVISTRHDQAITTKLMIGAGVWHITSCPCTQAYNQVLFRTDGQAGCPLVTHSQRSFTRLIVETDILARPSFEELLSCLESALHVTSDLLKRSDEAEIVLKSHKHPQFAEDAVREVAREAGRMFGDLLQPATKIIIETESLESIHIHDVSCRLETTLSEVLAAGAAAPQLKMKR